jgi:hypothetical protein
MQWWIDSYVLTGPRVPLHKVACSLENLPPPSCSDPCAWMDNSTLWSVVDSVTKFPGNYGAWVRTIRSYHLQPPVHVIFRRIRKISKSDNYLLHVCPYTSLSVRKEQLSSHSRDVHEIYCLRIFWKSIEKIQDLLKSYKNNGCCT